MSEHSRSRSAGRLGRSATGRVANCAPSCMRISCMRRPQQDTGLASPCPAAANIVDLMSSRSWWTCSDAELPSNIDRTASKIICFTLLPILRGGIVNHSRTRSPVAVSVHRHTLENEPEPSSLCSSYRSPTCEIYQGRCVTMTASHGIQSAQRRTRSVSFEAWRRAP